MSVLRTKNGRLIPKSSMKKQDKHLSIIGVYEKRNLVA